MQNYLMIENNVVINVVLWDGGSEWTPPLNATMLPQETTPSLIWGINSDETDYVLIEEIGQGQIGFTWNGLILTTNELKPIYVPPTPIVTTGTQNA